MDWDDGPGGGHTHACMQAPTHTHTRTHAHTHAPTHTCTHTRTHARTHACPPTHPRTLAHTHSFTYTRTHTHTRTRPCRRMGVLQRAVRGGREHRGNVGVPIVCCVADSSAVRHAAQPGTVYASARVYMPVSVCVYIIYESALNPMSGLEEGGTHAHFGRNL